MSIHMPDFKGKYLLIPDIKLYSFRILMSTMILLVLSRKILTLLDLPMLDKKIFGLATVFQKMSSWYAVRVGSMP